MFVTKLTAVLNPCDMRGIPGAPPPANGSHDWSDSRAQSKRMDTAQNASTLRSVGAVLR